jgi:hypothetical protein
MVFCQRRQGQVRQRAARGAVRKLQYSRGDGWYLFSDPIITANWNSSGEKWQVPIGGGIGRLFRVGKLPIKASIGVFDNVITPKYGARWQTTFEVTFIF